MSDPRAGLEKRFLLFPNLFIHAEVVTITVMLLLNGEQGLGLAPHPDSREAYGVMPLRVYCVITQLAGVQRWYHQSNSAFS